MAKAPGISYNLIMGKGGSFKRKDTDRLKSDIDQWFTSMANKQVGTMTYLRKLDVEVKLRSQLTKMYAHGLKFAIESWIGADTSAPNSQRKMSFRTDDYFDFGINRKSARGPTLAASFKQAATSTVPWQGLSYATLNAKMERQASLRDLTKRGTSDKEVRESRRFFVNTGALKNELLASHREMIKHTGVVKVDNRDHKGRFAKLSDMKKKLPTGKIKIRFLPSVKPTSLPGLKDGDWTKDSGNMTFEKALGLSPSTVRKLGNTNLSWKNDENGVKRPLLQPVFTYYTLFHAPKVAAGVMLELVTRANKGKNEGMI